MKFSLASRLTLTMLCAGVLLQGCFTGPRPTLLAPVTIPSVEDQSAQKVIDILTSGATYTFTVNYRVVTKFGNLSSDATFAHHPDFGSSMSVGDVRFIYAPDGMSFTCSTTTGECKPGIDESRVSDRQLVSTIFQSSAIERILQDTRVAVGMGTSTTLSIGDQPTTCTAIPVVDANATTQAKTYCAFDNLGVLASLETADLSITAISVTLVAQAEQFAG
jgi:hypothetical protein